MPSAVLSACRTVQPLHAGVDTDAKYIAVRSQSLSAQLFIPWTILVRKEDQITKQNDVVIVNPDEFGFSYFHANTKVIWQPVEPLELTHIVLVADNDHFVGLSQNKRDIPEHLPTLVRQGLVLPDIHCTVLACEPVDQGVLPRNIKNLTISVVESDCASDFKTDPIDVESFLNLEETANEIELDVCSLLHPVSPEDILPQVSHDVDIESIAFVHISHLAKLGLFSGDTVLAKSSSSTRYIFLYSHPNSTAVKKDTIYLPPMLRYNLCGSQSSGTNVAQKIIIEKLGSIKPVFDAAKDVVLSRVSSPQSTEKSNQRAFLLGLKNFFTSSSSRLVRNNDLIQIPINSSLSHLFISNSVSKPADGEEDGSNTHADDDAIDIESLVIESYNEPDDVVWFEVHGLPLDKQYIISPSLTRMVQSGIVQALSPSTALGWESYSGLNSRFNYFAGNDTDFKYAKTLLNLLSSTLQTRRSNLMMPSILLKSSKRGVGKSTVLQSVAGHLGLHVMALDSYDIIGDSDTKTLALLKAKLERASHTKNCVVCLKHFETLVKKNDADGKDTPLANGIVDILNEFSGLLITATVNDPDVITESIRMKFKFEVDVTVPTESERRIIFEYLCSDQSDFNNIGNLSKSVDKAVCTGFALRDDISVETMALQSAGLTALDLKSIVNNAKQMAASRATRDSILCTQGKIKIIPDDLSSSISNARGKFSDSIGAPKIPNVLWEDVGGLDMVKGDILDTIEMPLKHPELFAKGLKKRSGILFYGPPGTGKTLLAKAIATNFSLNFFSVKGPELLNMYIGESEANVRRIFQKARDAKPCVVFFDELDSVAPKRGNKGDSGGVMDRIVSQLLAELDGMNDSGDGVFCVGATNRPDLLDEALLRPGRFDKLLYLGISDTHEKQRTILEALTRKFELGPDVDLAAIAEKCPFTYTGADFYALSSDSMLNAMTRTAASIDSKITEYNSCHSTDPISIRKWFQDIATENDTQVKIQMADFEKAMNELVPSVSADELNHYLSVRNSFEGGSK